MRQARAPIARAILSLADYCQSKVPPHLRDELKVGYQVRGRSLALFEQRPSFVNAEQWIEIAVAQFRYDAVRNLWCLYWADRDARWHLYDGRRPARRIEALLAEVDRDPTGIF